MTNDSGSLHDVSVTADRDLCIGTGECQRLAPLAFTTDEDGIVVLLDTAADVDVELLRRAESACPAAAITVVADGA